jgi:transposase InsO family protein
LPAERLVTWLGIRANKFYSWKNRFGKVNGHNAWIPREHWLTQAEKQAILDFERQFPLEGYRRLSWMMLDADVAAASPSSVYRVLKDAGSILPFNGQPSKKGTGFVQPLRPNQHWHTDVSYINIAGSFYYLCSVLDGYSRAIIHWDVRESMTEGEIELILQKAKEQFPNAAPRVITDNGPQFVANDFKQFIRLAGMTHVRTSPFYPQSNGKIERWHKSLKRECIRPQTPLNLEDAKRITGRYVCHYNTVRLHSAIGYVAPADKLAGRDQAIFRQRVAKLAAAREQRRLQRTSMAVPTAAIIPSMRQMPCKIPASCA